MTGAAVEWVWEVDLNGVFVYSNGAIEKILGHKPEEIVGKRRILDFFHPDDRKRMLHKTLEVIENREPFKGFVYRSVARDGRIVWLSRSGTPVVDRDGNLTGYRGLDVEIPSKTIGERWVTGPASQSGTDGDLFRAFAETARDCIFVQDRELKYTFVNPYMEKLLERPASAIVGLSDDDLYGPEVASHLEKVCEKVLAGETVQEEQTRQVNGDCITFLDIRTPLKNSRHEIVRTCGMSRILRRSPRPPKDAPVRLSQARSTAMKAVVERGELASATDCIVLINGESGSGKDYLARYIHDRSSRANGPFYAINCATIPQELAESELFGHEEGSFTGARICKRGLVELAEGGTLFLNEIAELSLAVQAKLLTFLDTFTFTRVGGQKPIAINARLMAATNRNLAQSIADGTFRKELFYRINVFSITVPPLLERIEDIPSLAGDLLERLAKDMQL